MSTLTKVFVVLLVVFSIAFTTMTVSIVAQTANWRDLAEEYEQHAVVADTNLRHLIAANAADVAGLQDVINDLRERLGQLETEKQETINQVEQARSEAARSASERRSAEAINRALVAQLQAAEAARAEYQGQRDTLETRGLELERRNVDLNDRVNELTAQIVVMTEQRRQLEQQISIIRAENEKMAMASGRSAAGLAVEEAPGAGVGRVTAVTPIAQSPIRGQVLEVSGDLVTLSVGTADGVQKEMIFVVHRDDKYVRDVRITRVDPNQCAGRVVGTGPAPQPGDQVTDAAGLGTLRG
ncbi:MAG: hypothetical protein KJ749_00645 [Planctomycetes bacterium]|nr:hypothetical protein [Planctomycetota bacterium]